MHTPSYRAENAGALLGDWPRIPLPSTGDELARSANLGRYLSRLLDAESPLTMTAEWSFLGRLSLPSEHDIETILVLDADWGRLQGTKVMPGNGRIVTRGWTDAELGKINALAATQSITVDDALALLGERCVDVYLNGAACWAAVPINVWAYTLSGYQVLKKWLSYREFRLLNRALRPEETQYFAQVVRRIAAVLLHGIALDANYLNLIRTATGLPN